jgi:hypothetical protein
VKDTLAVDPPGTTAGQTGNDTTGTNPNSDVRRKGNGNGDGDGNGDPGPGIGEDSPARLPPELGARQCLDCPKPQLPPAMIRAGMTFQSLAQICVDTAGRVTDVRILHGNDPTVSAAVRETAATWRFAPLMLGEHAVPFCYRSHFKFSAY